MTQSFISERLVVSLVVLLLVLVVLLVLMVLCQVLRRTTSTNFTELKISKGGPTHKLTIRTEPGNARQLLDHLLDRVFLQVDTLRQEPGAEPGEALGGESSSHSGSDPEVSTAASLRSRAVNSLRDKLWKWITVTSPPAVSPPPPPPPPPNSPASQDNVDSEQLDAAAYVSLSSQSSSGSDGWEEEQHEESQL